MAKRQTIVSKTPDRKHKIEQHLTKNGGVLNTTVSDKVSQSLAAGGLFSPGTLVSSTNKTDNNITEILL